MKSETELTYQPTLKLHVGKPFNFDSPTLELCCYLEKEYAFKAQCDIDKTWKRYHHLFLQH